MSLFLKIEFYTEAQKKLKSIEYDDLSDEQKTVYDVLDYTLKR